MYFDTSKFIAEVEKRPPLYNTTQTEYYDRILKDELWTEVSKAMRDDWNTMSKVDKKKIKKEHQKKWKSIRDHFKKELNLIKNAAGGSGKKKKRYIYFDELSFLFPIKNEGVKRECLKNAENESIVEEDETNIGANETINTEEDRVLKRKYSTESESESIDMPSVSLEKRIYDLEPKQTAKRPCETFQYTVSDDILGNKAFLMSLLPLMNKISEHLILEARLGIMGAIQNIQRIQRNQEKSTNSMLNSSDSIYSTEIETSNFIPKLEPDI